MDSFKFKSLINTVFIHKKVITLSVFGFLLLALPMMIFVLQQQQIQRQSAATGTTVSLKPIADTYTDSDNPNASHGTDELLTVGEETGTKTAFLKFDLSQFANTTITNAVFRIYPADPSTNSQTLNSVDDTSWDENLTHSTLPSLGTSFATFGNTEKNIWKNISVTNKINEKKGQIFAFAVKSTGRNLLTFRSTESLNGQPTLLITYNRQIAPTATINPTSPTIPVSGTEITDIPLPTIQSNDTCASSAADVVIVLDKSLSMSQEIKQARAAARMFVDKIAQNANNRVAFVAFDHNTQVTPLTNDFESVKNAISATKELTWGTCIQCAIDKANEEFSLRGRTGLNRSVVFLTDGRPTRTASGGAETTVAEEAAYQSIRTGHTAHGYNLFNIGLGSGVNTTFLRETAEYTGGKYYFAPTPSDLDEVYLKISTEIGKGSITGVIFYDINNNGIKDTSEVMLSGWNITLKESNGTIARSTVSSENGGYGFNGLCNNKSYMVYQTVQSGWIQTSPLNPTAYFINTTNGQSHESKDFGNVKITKCTDGIDNDSNGYIDRKDSSCHTDWNPDNTESYDPTLGGESGIGESCADSKDNNSNGTIDGADPICHTDGNAANVQSFDPELSEFDPNSDVILNLKVFLHAIGSSGDNRNPASDFSNKNPLHPERKALIEVYNGTNQLAATAEARIQYASSSGNFIGNANIGKLNSDNYIIKIKTEQHLKNQFSGIQRISAGQELNLNPIALISGDVNNDNKLDILDYNILYGCYTSDLMPNPKNCNAEKALKADLNDEGKVNLFDLNLFIRELSVQTGA